MINIDTQTAKIKRGGDRVESNVTFRNIKAKGKVTAALSEESDTYLDVISTIKKTTRQIKTAEG